MARRHRAPALRPGDITAVHRAAKLWHANEIYYSPQRGGLGNFRHKEGGRIIDENRAIKRKYQRDAALNALPSEPWGDHKPVSLGSYLHYCGPQGKGGIRR